MPDPKAPNPLAPEMPPGSDLRQRLAQSLATATRAEAAIASFFLNNLDQLPFETAASVAEKIGVSEASVGRYCRSLGYAHFKALKSSLQMDLGERAWLIGDRLREFAEAAQDGPGALQRGLERDMAMLVANYETAASPAFDRVARRLARMPKVFVAGFQTERGHAQYLCNLLQYLRPEVHLADLAGGSFAELLLVPPGQACLVIFDARRYSRLSRGLAQAAMAAGLPVTLITDPYCDWAHGLVSEVFTVKVELGQFWDATSGFANLSGLLVNAVFQNLGPEVEARMTQVSNLYNGFIGHTEAPLKAPL